MRKKIYWLIGILFIISLCSILFITFLKTKQNNTYFFDPPDPKILNTEDSMKKLTENTWLVNYVINDDHQGMIHPKQRNVFILTFNTSEKKAILGTDCNEMITNYEINNDKIKFEPIISTKKYCENSQEQIIWSRLAAAESYEIREQAGIFLFLSFLGQSGYQIMSFENIK